MNWLTFFFVFGAVGWCGFFILLSSRLLFNSGYEEKNAIHSDTPDASVNKKKRCGFVVPEKVAPVSKMKIRLSRRLPSTGSTDSSTRRNGDKERSKSSSPATIPPATTATPATPAAPATLATLAAAESPTVDLAPAADPVADPVAPVAPFAPVAPVAPVAPASVKATTKPGPKSSKHKVSPTASPVVETEATPNQYAFISSK